MFGGNKFMKTLLHVIITLVLITLLIGPRLAMPEPANAVSSDFYSSTADGYIQNEGFGYTAVQSAASGSSVSTAFVEPTVGQLFLGSDYFVIMRSFLFFNTSDLPDNAVITSATLNLYGYQDWSGNADFNLTVVNGQPDRPSDSLTYSDYNIAYYSGNGGTLHTSSFTTLGYNTITLNSTGLGWINKTGTTKLGIFSSRDISATQAIGYEYVLFHSADSGTSTAPYLHIEYTVNATPTAFTSSWGTGVNYPVQITLAGSDNETCELTFNIVTPPSHGTLGTISNLACYGSDPFFDDAKVTYTPVNGYTGPDSFTFTVYDGTNTSDEATVYIYINQAPTITASILSPPGGTSYNVGDCFDVTAQISIVCPETVLSENIFESLFVKPAYATETRGSAGSTSVKATIGIAGNASTSEPATKDAADVLFCPPGTSEATVTWHVCCTGAGNVTITVTPYGEYYCQYIEARGIFDFLVKPVYATTIYDPCPIPASNLIADSITVYQIQPTQKPRMFEEDSYSGNGGTTNYSWAKGADTKVITASVQTGQVLAGQPVTIAANVVNRGDLEGSLTANLMINGQLEDSRHVTIAANSGKPIEFTVIKNDPGIYTADINGQQVYFTVLAPNAENSSKEIAYTIIGIIGALAILIGAALIIRKRLV